MPRTFVRQTYRGKSLTAAPRGTRYLTDEEKAKFVAHIAQVLENRAKQAAEKKIVIPPPMRDRNPFQREAELFTAR